MVIVFAIIQSWGASALCRTYKTKSKQLKFMVQVNLDSVTGDKAARRSAILCSRHCLCHSTGLTPANPIAGPSELISELIFIPSILSTQYISIFGYVPCILIYWGHRFGIVQLCAQVAFKGQVFTNCSYIRQQPRTARVQP